MKGLSDEHVRYDEKLGLLSEPRIQPSRASHRNGKLYAVASVAVLCIVGLLQYHLSLSHNLPEAVPNTELVDFDDITPSEKLEWHPCFTGGLKCARLTVPMDYHRPLNESKDHPKVHIALILYQGKHPGENKFSTSPLLVNPGGPGGSGVQLVLGFAKTFIHKIVGEEQDILGFDPRGIAATTPRADCYAYPLESVDVKSAPLDKQEDYITGNFHRTMWDLSFKEVGLVNSTASSLQQLDTRARAVAKLCAEKDAIHGKDSILKYLHTPSVARDMISIVDAWDEWTATLSKNSAAAIPAELERKGEPEEAASYPLDTKGKLVYWGFSYGTLLGATFASMFPDRVGRVILDGVVDADVYVSPIWSESLVDADAGYNSFSKYCQQAKEECALYRDGDQVEDIRARFDAVLDNLKDNPITSINTITKAPTVVNLSDIRFLLFSTLYSPTAMYGIVALLVDMLHRGLRDEVAQLLGVPPAYHREPFCVASLPSWTYPTESQPAIMCSDKRYPFNEDLPALEKRFEELSSTSSWADVWMTIMLGCEGWEVKAIDPPMKWDDHPTHKSKPIKTAFPVLFISNTADPVTPLAAGVKMAKKFVDAGLIEQHSEGHCSMAAVSKCTIHKLRDYLIHGKVPPPPVEGKDLRDGKWEKCDADEWPFHPYTGDKYIAANGVEATEDAEMLTASKGIQDVLRRTELWGKPKNFLDLDILAI